MSKECDCDRDESWKLWASLILAICIYNCVEMYFAHEIKVEKIKIEEKENVGK